MNTSVITPIQIKMARAALGWGVRELAEKAKVTPNTISRCENGGNTLPVTLEAIKNVCEAAGIEFLADNGVRLKSDLLPNGN